MVTGKSWLKRKTKMVLFRADNAVKWGFDDRVFITLFERNKFYVYKYRLYITDSSLAVALEEIFFLSRLAAKASSGSN